MKFEVVKFFFSHKVAPASHFTIIRYSCKHVLLGYEYRGASLPVSLPLWIADQARNDVCGVPVRVDSRLRGNDGKDVGTSLRRVVAVVTLHGMNRFVEVLLGREVSYI